MGHDSLRPKTLATVLEELGITLENCEVFYAKRFGINLDLISRRIAEEHGIRTGIQPDKSRIYITAKPLYYGPEGGLYGICRLDQICVSTTFADLRNELLKSHDTLGAKLELTRVLDNDPFAKVINKEGPILHYAFMATPQSLEEFMQNVAPADAALNFVEQLPDLEKYDESTGDPDDPSSYACRYAVVDKLYDFPEGKLYRYRVGCQEPDGGDYTDTYYLVRKRDGTL